MDSYATLDDAIYYATQLAAELGMDGTERIAAVYKDKDGQYRFTDPQGSGYKSKAKARIAYPRDAVLEALVHNHPKDERLAWNAGQHEFSPEDIKMARSLGIPNFMSFGDDMQIRRYDSGKQPGFRRTNAAGAPFTHIPEVQPAGQRIEPKPEHLISALRGGAQ